MSRLLHWIPAIAQAALIIVFSHQSRPPGADLGPDYVLHFLAYGVLGAAVVWGQSEGLRREYSMTSAGLGWLICSLYGASDELHQWFIPDRSATVADWLADTIGSGVAIGLGFLVIRLLRKKPDPGLQT